MKDYYTLTKPGIIRGNIIAAVAGFLFATQRSFDVVVFLFMVIGLSAVIGSACVFNNIIDRKIDKHMERTKRRAMVTGSIGLLSAYFFGTTLGVIGFILLWFFVNPLASVVSMVGFFFYVVVYTYFKRVTVSGTVIGSVSGAIPPVVGYTAVSNTLDAGAVLLFLILTFWQMPHFYAIAIFRINDYRAAAIPVLSIVKGIQRAKKEIIVYVVLFLIAAMLPYAFGYRGVVYFVTILLFGSQWLYRGLHLWHENDEKWSGKMFQSSLIVLSVWCLAILADVIVNMLL